jgi:hypothetical protein
MIRDIKRMVLRVLSFRRMDLMELMIVASVKLQTLSFLI